jgi:murein DD-endopeptidase MepM/ murein hydrolase activator NlpD
LFQFQEAVAGSGGGTAALSLDRSLPRPPVAPTFGTRVGTIRGRIDDIDLLTDLGARIGSREWFRGFATCAALCYAAYAFAPGFSPIIGASPAPLADAQWDEARALAIAPLAYGGDTGRRMAATDAVEDLEDTPERPTLNLVATLGRGNSFAHALQRSGVSEIEAETVADMVQHAAGAIDVAPGTAMDLTLGRRSNRNVPRPLDALAFRARFDLKIAIERAGERLVLNRIPIAVDNTPLRIQGFVGSSLYRAARAAGAPAKAVESYLHAIATQLNVGSLGSGDRFDIIVEHRRAATGETESGQLLYAGLDRPGGKDLRLMQWGQAGKAQWFEASGVGKASGMLQRPVPGIVLSGFGLRRHPILDFVRMHKGIDFRASYGTPILAASDGRVAGAGWRGGYGQQVSINHAGGLSTSYSHMSRILARAGQFVRQGQVIGYVGATGLATGPHLHYELHRNGVAINPLSVKFTMRAQLSGGDLAAFKGKLHRLLSLPAGAARTKALESASASPSRKSAKG